MIENGQPAYIQQPLQTSLMMSPQISRQLEPHQIQPKDLARQVDNIIAHLPSQFAKLEIKGGNDNKMQQEQKELIKEEKKSNFFRGGYLSRYNYTGKAYRFEIEQQQLEISKPDPNHQNRSKTELDHGKSKQERYSIPRDNESIQAEDSFNPSQVKFPSHNYYIMFERKESKKKKSDRDRLSKTVCLENKVRKLEAEVKMLKQYGMTSTNGSFKKDKKMKLDQLLNSMLG